MAYKTCSACSGSGQKTFVGDTHATTEHCHACDGTGSIRVADPVPPKPPKPLKPTGTDTTGSKPHKNTKFIKLAVSTVAFIFGYWVTLEHITDTFYIAAAVGLICFFIMYRWFYFFMTILTIAIIVFAIWSEKILSFF